MDQLREHLNALVNMRYRKPVNEDFEFLEDFPIDPDSLNGIEIHGVCLPEELLIYILSFLDPKEILRCSLVCKYWHRIAKSNVLWQEIYNKREYPKKAKNWPWYILYLHFSTNWFKNMIKNGNGEKKFKHWHVVTGEESIVIEDEPVGCVPLPYNVPDFNGHGSCFSTSYMACTKYQTIKTTKLLRYIIKHHRPVLYASEWFAGRFDCGCEYKLLLSFNGMDSTKESEELLHAGPIQDEFLSRELLQRFDNCPETRGVSGKIAQWKGGKSWEKKEIFCNDYPVNLQTIYFCNYGRDTQFWAGNYGAKMAGGMLKFVLESIEPIGNNDNSEETA